MRPNPSLESAPSGHTLSSRRRSHRSRGQSLVEFALVVPILLLVFAAAADLGRAFYAYVAIENGVKEGAFYGARSPLCVDGSVTGCARPRNVQWRVQNELNNLTNPDGTALVPNVECIDQTSGAVRTKMTDCIEGDTYRVSLTYPFRFLTPIIGDILGGTFDLNASASAVVLNLAFDPTPGASVQKLVRVANAVNGAAIVANCLEPDEFDSDGYYRSPCHNTTSPDPGDTLSATFESGVAIQYKLTVGNSGAQPLTGVTVGDSTGSTGCSFPSSWAVGYSNEASGGCVYSRTAPAVPGGQSQVSFANIATVDANEILPEQDSVTVTVQPPPPNWAINVYTSPFALGDDGDGTNGTPDFKGVTTISQGENNVISNESAWFMVVVRNIGGATATGVTIASTLGPLPFNQNDPAQAVCDAMPSSMAPAATFTCRYRVDAGSPGILQNTVSVNSDNAVPPARNSVADVTVTTCASPSRVIPSLVGLTKSGAQAAWTAAGLTGALSTWGGQPNALTATQSRQAFQCMPAATTMTIGR